ncbi:MAG: alpha/beta fold hydrolase [Actinobacteria bacterium]|nr:alpha/beta fold hydrolase [Actinomycetota bacterium]
MRKDERCFPAATAVALILVILLATACGSSATTTSIDDSAPSITTTTPTNSAPGPPADQEQLTAKALAVLDAFVAEDYEAVHQTFDETMKTALPLPKLQEVWEQVTDQAGSYIGNTGVRTEEVDGYQAIIVQAQFKNAPLDVRVVFDQTGLVAGLFFQAAETSYKPPPYVKTEAFTSREITVVNGHWELPGTLTLPVAEELLPGIVLVHGSGPNDRNETIGPNQPFRDLAEGLASIGVAVLRYDKRTLVYAQETVANADLTLNEETVDDAVAAFRLLRGLPEIDPARCFVLGHSLGGYALPRIGALTTQAAGFVIMAGAARPLEDLILEQMEYIYSLNSSPTEQETANMAAVREQVQRVKDSALSYSTPAHDLPLNIPATYWLDLRDYDPPLAAATLARPTLVLQGGRDYQVTEADLRLWEAALSTVPGCSFTLYPELNHLFMEGQGKSIPSDYLRQGHMAEVVIKDIGTWIDQFRQP